MPNSLHDGTDRSSHLHLQVGDNSIRLNMRTLRNMIAIVVSLATGAGAVRMYDYPVTGARASAEQFCEGNP